MCKYYILTSGQWLIQLIFASNKNPPRLRAVGLNLFKCVNLTLLILGFLRLNKMFIGFKKTRLDLLCYYNRQKQAGTIHIGNLYVLVCMA